jgi:hypothetical protein
VNDASRPDRSAVGGWASGGMADARGLGPRGETLAGSSPVSPTNRSHLPLYIFFDIGWFPPQFINLNFSADLSMTSRSRRREPSRTTHHMQTLHELKRNLGVMEATQRDFQFRACRISRDPDPHNAIALLRQERSAWNQATRFDPLLPRCLWPVDT